MKIPLKTCCVLVCRLLGVTESGGTAATVSITDGKFRVFDNTGKKLIQKSFDKAAYEMEVILGERFIQVRCIAPQ